MWKSHVKISISKFFYWYVSDSKKLFGDITWSNDPQFGNHCTNLSIQQNLLPRDFGKSLYIKIGKKLYLFSNWSCTKKLHLCSTSILNDSDLLKQFIIN